MVINDKINWCTLSKNVCLIASLSLSQKKIDLFASLFI